MDASIQLINYNTKKYLEVCIDGAIRDLKEASIQGEILVLDNASLDDLSDLQEKYKKEQISFIRSEKNLGFGGGHNILAKQAKGEHLLLLNPDIEFIEKDTVKKLINTIKGNKCAVVGPRLITKENTTQTWDHGELKGIRAWIMNNRGDSYWKDRKEPGDVAWVSGAAFLIKKSVFEEINGFDEGFFLYKEEEDLCLRLRNKGYQIWYESSIAMMHIGSVVAKKDEHIGKSKEYFRKKHFEGRVTYWLARLIAPIFLL